MLAQTPAASFEIELPRVSVKPAFAKLAQTMMNAARRACEPRAAMAGASLLLSLMLLNGVILGMTSSGVVA